MAKPRPSVQHDVRMATFERVLGHAPSWFDERRKGDLLAVLNDDVNQLERFLDKGANDLLQVGTTVIVVGAIFFAIPWEVALLAFMPVPLILGVLPVPALWSQVPQRP